MPVTNEQRQPLNQPGVQVTAGYGPGEDRGANQDQNLDKTFAACLLTANKGEVELGKLAAQRATDRDVKAFAEQMVKDHSQQVDKLQQFIGTQEPSDRRSQIDKQIAERCASDLKKELEGKSGKDFDACYVGAQIGGHMHMAAALAVLSDQTHRSASRHREGCSAHGGQASRSCEEADGSIG